LLFLGAKSCAFFKAIAAQGVRENQAYVCQQNASHGDIISTSVAPEGHPYTGIYQLCTRVTNGLEQAGARLRDPKHRSG